jgi:GTP-binding protein Era
VLKEVGRQARLELKELIGSKVFLELWVKVRRDWPEDPAFLRSLGLGE